MVNIATLKVALFVNIVKVFLYVCTVLPPDMLDITCTKLPVVIR